MVMMDSGVKRLSSPVVKFMTTGITSPSPTAGPRSRSFDTPGTRMDRETLLAAPMHHSAATTGDRGTHGTTTPLLTPHRRSSLVALSPSRTLSESLTSLASSTVQQLEHIWDEIGYSPEDRATQLADLLAKIQGLCEQKIAEENGVAVEIRETIAKLKQEMRVLCAALKKAPDTELLRDHNGQTPLIDELQALEAAIEGVREAANAAKKDLLECRAYLIEAHEALGLEMDPQWHDAESDLTPLRREEFHQKKAEMKDQLATRSEAIIRLVRDCQHVIKLLCIDGENANELDKRIMGSLVRSKDGSFIMASKIRTNTCVGLTSSAVNELTNRLAELHAEKRKRKELLQTLGAEISVLWEKLGVPVEEQMSFFGSVDSLSKETIEKGQAELKRLRNLKAAMLDKLMLEARSTIRFLWEQINASKEMRAEFEPFRVPEHLFSDELLERHDEYITVLQSRLEEMKPIIELIKHREVILRERMELEELQKDPERLRQRGAFLTQQLMEEEKMARRIKNLPKLTGSLLNALEEWKEQYGEDFQYSGHVYLEVMEKQEQEWQEYKSNELMRKQMKKQEVMGVAADNRLHPRGAKTKNGTRPLGDARIKENLNSKSVSQNKSGYSKGGVRESNRIRSETLT